MRGLRTVAAAIAAVLLIAGFAGSAAAASTVVVNAEEFPTLYAFYHDVLRLPVVDADAGSGRAVFDADGTRLVLLRGGRAGGSNGPRLLIGVDGLAEAEAFLRDRNIAWAPMRDAVGATVGLFFADPEGNPLGFVERALPASAWLAPVEMENLRRERVDSGRVPLMVWGGVYGLWLGVAVPVGLGADGPTPIGIGMLVGGPMGVFAASELSRHGDMGKGRAGFITLAGTFGTWQGLGWAGDADADAEDVVLAGAATGLGASVLATVASGRMSISEGQSTVLTSAASWGAWYGLVGSMIAGDDDTRLPPMLLGSAGGLALGGLWALNHDVTASRARLVSLGGLIGTGAGFGVDLITQVDDSETAFLVAGIGGLVGKILTVSLTASHGGGDIGDAGGSGILAPFALRVDGRGDPWVEVVRARFP